MFFRGVKIDEEQSDLISNCLASIERKLRLYSKYVRVNRVEEHTVCITGMLYAYATYLSLQLVKANDTYFLYADLDDEISWHGWDFSSQEAFEDAIVEYIFPYIEGMVLKDQGKQIYDIEKICKYIQNVHKARTWNIEKKEDQVSMCLSNPMNPRFPLFLHCHKKDGIYVSLSKCGIIMEHGLDVGNLFSILKDIVEDQVVVAIAYKDEEMYKNQGCCMMTRFFHLKEKEDKECLSKFVNHVIKPRFLLQRYNPFAFHGVIEISNFSGKKYHKIYRK